MVRLQALPIVFVGVIALGLLPALAASTEKEKPTQGVISGIVMDKADKGQKSITVRPDGEAEPVKYIYDDTLDKKSLDALSKTIYVVGRVRLAYKMDGDTARLVSIEKIPGQPNGVVFGEVLATHGWWLEVKPKNGPPDGFACTYPKEKWEATEAQIKTLNKGDRVGIKFYTDGERHRIVLMEKKP